MRTLSISTLGELKRSPLAISSVGELVLVQLIPVDDIKPGGSSGTAEDQRIFLARIRRDDEEILAIIMASMDIIE